MACRSRSGHKEHGDEQCLGEPLQQLIGVIASGRSWAMFVPRVRSPKTERLTVLRYSADSLSLYAVNGARFDTLVVTPPLGVDLSRSSHGAWVPNQPALRD